MGWDHRSVEGALYGLGRPPEAAPSAPRLQQVRQPAVYGSRQPATTARLEVGMVVGIRLSADDLRVVHEHYVTRTVSHPYRQRKRIIGTLLMALNEGN